MKFAGVYRGYPVARFCAFAARLAGPDNADINPLVPGRRDYSDYARARLHHFGLQDGRFSIITGFRGCAGVCWRPGSGRGLGMPLPGLEPGRLASEARALSSELQGHIGGFCHKGGEKSSGWRGARSEGAPARAFTPGRRQIRHGEGGVKARWELGILDSK
jgi:hypothetical protein